MWEGALTAQCSPVLEPPLPAFGIAASDHSQAMWSAADRRCRLTCCKQQSGDEAGETALVLFGLTRSEPRPRLVSGCAMMP
ncbi:hypothetical protein NDU88_005139 [Pleurodeles waltl]|uniref:Uncharacterized protein n=1 Tax=Pleurodeles waltl TaxID=8319 RepID=A0AAV7WZU7_PLEWA|nr:hypothetical protein NDU88_005139 [Pleurodeles waltl]